MAGMVVKKVCSVEQCDKKVMCKGLCNKHYKRLKRHGDPLMLKRRADGEGALIKTGYIVVGETHKFQHRMIAERVLGRKLKNKESVHHIDENRSNNNNNNLLICSENYHKLIHMRMNALKTCGDPNRRKCQFCSEYDLPSNLYIGFGVYHRKCKAKYVLERYYFHKNRKKVL